MNLRISYDFGVLFRTFTGFKIIADIFHLFSRREAVLLQQHKYLSDDGEGNRMENTEYLVPEVYQSPMTIRLGFEIDF